jgi:hypothetical protein
MILTHGLFGRHVTEYMILLLIISAYARFGRLTAEVEDSSLVGSIVRTSLVLAIEKHVTYTTQ